MKHTTILFLLFIPLLFLQRCTMPDDELPSDSLFPKEFDLRTNGLLTPCKNQGDLGSCWAFASVGLLEYHIKKDTGSEVDLSEQHLVNCAGFGPFDGMNFLQNNGVAYEEKLPYQEKVMACSPSVIPVYKIENFEIHHVTVYSFSERITFHKKLLSEKGPFITHLDLYNDLSFYKNGIYTYDGKSEGPEGHIVLVVGWKDDSSAKNGGYWICKNSWGTNWGQNGYFFIPYDEVNIGIYYSITASKPKKLF